MSELAFDAPIRGAAFTDVEPVAWTINGEPLFAHQLPPEEPSDER